ncbi:MAG: hypothetical protein IKE42_17285 [Aquamicrobium sp.]|jgi:hypothetical protein|uniref:hypothetical protein n=1 Tax=Mesorhizobium sp. Pch-S TaxID=2082387 RepID=UPI001013515D|nr:hypothetical protein [Mesorhizobium sp. Pch-S]MBR2689607.1 hypothetical protein [Aquamicrobium sp.]QAZ41877.1 hypothetical protein C1M53_01735 [Mesorhizobium sp. Pch-S]
MIMLVQPGDRTMLRVCLSAAVLLPSLAMADEIKIDGRWNTGNGPITISRLETGEYTIVFDNYAGKTVGKLADNVLSGTWQDVAKVTHCPTEQNGSTYWGTFSISFYGPPAIKKPAFQGILAFCDNQNEGTNFSGELAD